MCFLEISFENVPSEIYIFRDFFFCAPEGFVSLSFTTWHELNFEHHQLRPLTFYLTNSELMWNSHFGSNRFLDILTFQASKVFGFKMRQPLALVLKGLAASCSCNVVFVCVSLSFTTWHELNFEHQTSHQSLVFYSSLPLLTAHRCSFSSSAFWSRASNSNKS